MLRFLIRTLGVRPRVRVARTYNVPRDLSIGSRRINSRRGTGNSRSIDMLKKDEEENRQPRQINGSLVDPVDHLNRSKSILWDTLSAPINPYFASVRCDFQGTPGSCLVERSSDPVGGFFVSQPFRGGRLRRGARPR